MYVQTLTALLLLRAPSTPPESISADVEHTQAAERTLTLRVTSTLGEGDDEVRQVVRERIRARAEALDIQLEDSPRLLLVNVGWSSDNEAAYQVQLSLATDEAPPHRIESFDCRCSAPELLDKLDDRLAVHLPPIFDAPEAPPPEDPAPEVPPPRLTPPPVDASPRAYTRRHNAAVATTAAGSGFIIGGGILLGFALGIDSATTSDGAKRATAATAGAAIGAGTIAVVVGALVLRQELQRRSQPSARHTPIPRAIVQRW